MAGKAFRQTKGLLEVQEEDTSGRIQAHRGSIQIKLK